MVDPYDVILSPWITEKSLNARRVADPEGYYKENNNRIEFIVRRRATKADIKAAIEELLEVKVSKVNTRIMKTGKHASVKLAEGYDAEEMRALSAGVLNDTELLSELKGLGWQEDGPSAPAAPSTRRGGVQQTLHQLSLHARRCLAVGAEQILEVGDGERF